ncbi:hypothetical protein dsx2_0683 [Desulfovibrio sp. X2]|uniref:hypothetical protein n=1 Tax=Desulfovibrio sp. X2 TaxID=941449 RepID=UPI000358E708|nr:hypothetical protein [Desulfovibrio sp. X2]EPR37337.1 hypothetical protein dsx2_0683 [Desulfovibrio sp. X2]
MFNVKELLEELKASPYELIDITAPHTGTVEFVLKEPGATVQGPHGTYREKPGTLIATLEREKNKKPIRASLNGVLESVETAVAGRFVEAGTKLATIRHYLTSKEVIDLILKKALHLFVAPERAKYYFLPDIDKKMRASGKNAVEVRPGMELFIMSRMKRETVLPYNGPEGKIYAVYFKLGENVESGQPLIGVCPGEQLPLIQDVVNRVRSEWEEQG